MRGEEGRHLYSHYNEEHTCRSVFIPSELISVVQLRYKPYLMGKAQSTIVLSGSRAYQKQCKNRVACLAFIVS